MALEVLIAELNRKREEETETLNRRYQDYGHAVFNKLGALYEAEAHTAIEEQLKVTQSIENALTEVQRLALTGIAI